METIWWTDRRTDGRTNRHLKYITLSWRCLHQENHILLIKLATMLANSMKPLEATDKCASIQFTLSDVNWGFLLKSIVFFNWFIKHNCYLLQKIKFLSFLYTDMIKLTACTLSYLYCKLLIRKPMLIKYILHRTVLIFRKIEHLLNINIKPKLSVIGFFVTLQLILCY